MYKKTDVVVVVVVAKRLTRFEFPRRVYFL